MQRVCKWLAFSFGAVALSATSAWASPILVGTSVTVALTNSGFSPDLSDTVTVVSPGAEIMGNDSTNIGGLALLTGEFINVENASITFQIFGGDVGSGTPPVNPSCSGVGTCFLLTGYGPDAVYTVSDLFSDLSGEITGVTVKTTNAVTGNAGIDPTLAGEFSFDAHTLTFDIGQIAILETADNFGTVEFDLAVSDTSTLPPPIVPEPASLWLLGAGLSGLVLHSRRRRRRS